jgi:tetratricopeptide (TPR) repeat protein
MRTRLLVAPLLLALAPLTAQKGVTLDQLAELAKTRAEKLRPELEKKLEPFLATLAGSYRTDFVAIDATIVKILKLGDTIVPLLLEKLEPKRESLKNRNLAANCSRILAQMEPASFLDTLIEIAEGENYTGIGLAIPLLGETGSIRAGDSLTRLLDRLDAPHARSAVRALTKLGHKGAIVKVAKGLPYRSLEDEQAAVSYLRTLKAVATAPEIARALKEVKRVPEIMRYVRLLGVCAPDNADIAHQLLPLFESKKLDSTYFFEIVEVLAIVAPRGHQPTIDRLRKLLETPAPGSLELRAAKTLKTLGDRTGPDALKRNLVRLASRSRRNYLHWSNLGNYYLEFGDNKKAVSSYTSAIKYATSPSVKSMLYIHLAKSQARRKPPRYREVRNALRDSTANYKRLMEAAAEDPALAATMKHSVVKKFMDAFGK